MRRLLYEIKCRCKEDISIAKKRKASQRSEGKPFLYPEELTSKTFQIKYEKKLSPVAKFLLNSFQTKYLYYAIDDILYLFNLNRNEQETLLSILYYPVLSLQNTISINFFDIWIHEIYINEGLQTNRFLEGKSGKLESLNYITIKILYKTKIPIKKEESFW